jgi:hypothetical protein
MPVRAPDQNQSRFSSRKSENTDEPAAASNDLERRREIGQFFTPPMVADFMWEMSEIIHGARFSKRARVIDPSCGEGVFLRVAAERGKISPDCLFGADIDETLVPLWRHDSVLRGAHLFQANGLLDLPARGLRQASFDLAVGNPPFAGKGVRDLLRFLEESDDNNSSAEMDLFGEMVLNERPAPVVPPLTPQERTRLDQLARELSGYSCWRITKESLENGDTEVSDDANSAELFADSRRTTERRNGVSDFDAAASLVARWPARQLLDPKQPEIRLLLRRLASTAIEVLFMERFLRLAKPGGLIAVIVPESIVASSQLAPLRGWLLTQMDLLAVVSLPQKVFAGVGANAKTSIIFARRLLEPRNGAGVAANVPESESSDDAGSNGATPAVFMAAPNTGSPDYSLERYLADVCRSAKERPNAFTKGGT